MMKHNLTDNKTESFLSPNNRGIWRKNANIRDGSFKPFDSNATSKLINFQNQ